MHDVGSDREEFSVEVHHGGFFLGFGHLRSYVDEKIDWFDRVEKDTWSPLWLEDFVQQLGYEKNVNIKFYWLLPGRTLDDGLRVIASDHDTTVMASVVEKVQTLVVYVDHEDNFGGGFWKWDDVVHNSVADLPKVLSPKKIQFVDKKPCEKLPVFYTDMKKGRVEQGPSKQEHKEGHSKDSDPEEVQFMDSDYEIDGGDDELFEGNVDTVVKSVKDNKKARGSQLKVYETNRPAMTNDEDDTEDEALDMPDSDGDGEGRVKFKSWRDEDMANPSFFVGQVFPSVVSLRQLITEYSARNRVEIKYPRNENRRLRAHCAEGCPWNLYASMDSRVQSFVVKTYYGVHNCQKEWVLRRCTSRWLADKYIDAFRANDKMSITSFGRIVQKDWNLMLSRSKLARARRLILSAIHGDEVQQYNFLWDFGKELRRSNPGSTFYLNLAGNLFNTCYMSIDACKRGFLAGCRPIICLDGCHIKTKFGGQLLTAVGMDPNDCIYPIAMAVVEVESLASWKWFLQTLKDDLHIDNTYPWTIMTDKQKVCMSNHSHCLSFMPFC